LLSFPLILLVKENENTFGGSNNVILKIAIVKLALLLHFLIAAAATLTVDEASHD
jgi:hypothetical protein